MKNRVFAIIQARMGSTRLPGKVLKELAGQPILYHIIRRIERVKDVSKIIVATSFNKSDDLIIKFTEAQNIPCFRGSEDDVLGRYFHAAQMLGAESGDAILRLTADNPFVDPVICEELLSYFRESPYRYAVTAGYPIGIGVEVFEFCMLKEAYEKAVKSYEREHVTPFMYRPGQIYGTLTASMDYSNIRLTVDTQEDYRVAEIIYDSLYQRRKDFGLPEIISYLKKHPEVAEINRNIHQKSLGE